MPPKVTKKVWNPDRFETNIGNGTYIIEPQPIERIMEFDQTAKQIADSFGEFSDKYFVTNGTGKDVEGPFDDEQEATDYIRSCLPDIQDLEAYFEENPDERLDIRVEGVSIRDVLSALVSAPYPPLKALIPDLKEEDVRGASLPNLKFVFDMLIEVNGVGWFERFVKNSLAPVQADIMNMLVEAVKGALKGTTETISVEDGETA